MYLFTRRRRLDPEHLRAAMAFSTDIAATVTQITGLDVYAWMAFMGPDEGTITWSTRAEHLADLEAGFDKLAADDGYLRSVEEADELFEGPIEDGLAQVVAGEPATGDAPAYVSIVRGRAANGRLGDAMTLGVEVAETASRLTGLSTLFVAEATGDYGGVAWITGHQSIQSVEASLATLMGDPGWLPLVDRVGPAYEHDVTQSIQRRIS
jgi:hypothetical protein